MKSVLSEIQAKLTNRQIIRSSSGERGEVVAAALLGHTLDVLRAKALSLHGRHYDANKRDQSMSGKVCAATFLKALGVTPPSAAKKYYVNFTHFVRLELRVIITKRWAEVVASMQWQARRALILCS